MCDNSAGKTCINLQYILDSSERVDIEHRQYDAIEYNFPISKGELNEHVRRGSS